MRSVLPFLVLPAAAGLLSADRVAPDATPRGRYVEARTASVFAGACHYGGEATTAGREALLAWHFDGGSHRGVELAGLDVVAVVAGDGNLAEQDVARHALLYVGERTTEAQREALRALVVERLGATLGRVELAGAIPLTLDFGPETYRVEAQGRFLLRGALLPDRACCAMPFQVWYEPLAPVARPIVGNNDAFEFHDKRLGRVWSRPGENASFAGAFRFESKPVTAR